MLFLFREPGSGMLAYKLQQYMVWNRALVTQPVAQQVYPDLCSAIAIKGDD